MQDKIDEAFMYNGGQGTGHGEFSGNRYAFMFKPGEKLIRNPLFSCAVGPTFHPGVCLP